MPGTSGKANGTGAGTTEASNGPENANGKPESGSAEPEVIAAFPQPISPIDIDLGGTGSGTGAESERKRRPYRRRIPIDAGAGAETEKVSPDLTDLKDLIYSIHLGVAAIARAPEMELDSAESKRFADSIVKLSKQYDHKVSPKLMAWMGFSSTAAGIYVPRIMAISKRLSEKPDSQPAPRPIDAPRGTPRPAPAAPRDPATLTPGELFREHNTPVEDSR